MDLLITNLVMYQIITSTEHPHLQDFKYKNADILKKYKKQEKNEKKIQKNYKK